MTVPVFIASLALLFTVGSFYWIQARKGRLKLYPVVTFSAQMTKDRLVLRIPVITFNSGALPRVVTALRLVATDERGASVVMDCQTFRKTVGPVKDDLEDMAHAYSVPGRQVVTKYAHFVVDALPRFTKPQPVVFEMQAMLDQSTSWRRLGGLTMHTEIIHTSSYISYSNSPDVWPANLLSDAAEYRSYIHDPDDMPLDTNGNPVH